MPKVQLIVDEMYPYIIDRIAKDDIEWDDEHIHVFDITDAEADRWKAANKAFFNAQNEMMELLKSKDVYYRNRF